MVTRGAAGHGEGHGDINSSGGNVLISGRSIIVRRSRFSNGFARGFGGGMGRPALQP